MSSTATIVPAPTVPPSAKPAATKNRSQATRTQRNSMFGSLSDKMIATRSFGPVPALLLMTIDMPSDSTTHPTSMLAMRSAMGDISLMAPWSSQVNASMMGPPQNAQTTVPGLT